MQRTVTFLAWTPKRNFYDEKLECSLRFSVVNSSLLGTAREHESTHTLKVIMSDILLVNWGLPEAADPSAISENMVKLALQSAEDYIAGQLKKGPLEENLPSLSKRPDNSPDSCPYKLSNIQYPGKTKFVVEMDDQPNTRDSLHMHPNIQVLLGRMDDALRRNDHSGVLHASASIFETMAKDVIGLPTVENKTLKSFFDRYRKDSSLPNEILDDILGIYDFRNITPLAGHGSTKTPTINRESAIALSEM